MLEELDRIVATTTPSPETTEVVLLVHGLMRTADSMKPIETELLRVDAQSKTLDPTNQVHRTAILFSYASTRDPISAHAAALRELVENLPGKPRISFVGHSLGNIKFSRDSIAQ